ncbi:hypothetical protein E2C01_058208 [Portunus trituberculatus]|uniref:Uncharacterized protein n=1 Tax=Portunus trituberculatus TaxID=210409 RepID=A0A5B7H434_PORTR|nr:hypothetical protein [Portunus trituberculatus]
MEMEMETEEEEEKEQGGHGGGVLKLSVSPMLSLFNIRRVANTPCLSSSGENGTCYNARECKRLGGVTSGSCKTGGNCCVCEYRAEGEREREREREREM